MRTRRVGRLLGSAALALLLAGCFKVNMDVEVTPDNTVSGSAVVAVDESLLQLSGQNVDQLFQDMDLSDLPPGATVDAYSEDGFVGQEITFEDVPLDAFTGDNALSSTGTGDDLNIVRQGDEFRVTGALDMSGEEFTGTEIPSQFLDNFEFRISITFPGEVKSATGEIDGNTVTWEPKFGQNTRLDAVASAIPSGSSPVLLIALVAAGALLLGAITFFLTHRKAAVAPAGPIEGGSTMPLQGSPPAMEEGPVGPVPPVEPPPAATPPGTDAAPHEGGGAPPPPPPPPGAP
jgi:hypothetical protein